MNRFAIAAVILAIGTMNFFTGLRWSRLDHNPWSGRFLGGAFSGNTPGINPGALDVETIRHCGRRMMVSAPILTFIVLIIVSATYRPS